MDTSEKKRPMCDRGLSNGESIVIITIIDISVISPFSLIAILKKTNQMRKLCGIPFVSIWYKDMKFSHVLKVEL